jgi:hypothetical protein
MPLEHNGILIAGEVLAGTEWCRRADDAWWDPRSNVKHPKWDDFGTLALDRYQLRKRKGTLDLLVGHWTAGEAGTASFDDDAKRVVSVLKRRASPSNPDRRYKVSIQFVIGACGPDDEYAPVWQTMDLGLGYGSVHVGRASVNRRSIGVEVVSAGLDGHANVRHREEREVYLIGRRRRVLEFFPGQLNSWVRLANALSGRELPTDIHIPRRIPIDVLEDDSVRPRSSRFTKEELANWSGAMEHYCMDNTTKVDAGTLLIRALLLDGWDGVAAS